MGLSNFLKMTAFLAVSSVAANAADTIRGFSKENSDKQYALEAEIDKRISIENMR